jgi:hypothetical protein
MAACGTLTIRSDKQQDDNSGPPHERLGADFDKWGVVKISVFAPIAASRRPGDGLRRSAHVLRRERAETAALRAPVDQAVVVLRILPRVVEEAQRLEQ